MGREEHLIYGLAAVNLQFATLYYNGTGIVNETLFSVSIHVHMQILTMHHSNYTLNTACLVLNSNQLQKL